MLGIITKTDIGTFENSIVPGMDNFIDFPDYVEKNLRVSNNKKIAMYCTGGIRCEIASSYLMSKGFSRGLSVRRRGLKLFRFN